MPHLNIKIQRVLDPNPALPGIDAEEATIKNVIILEQGMASGDASVAFHIETPSGDHYIAQTSAKLLKSLVIALQGAEERFKTTP